MTLLAKRRVSFMETTGPRMMVITARCGHQWITTMSMTRYPDDGCRMVERLVDKHEQQCTATDVVRNGAWWPPLLIPPVVVGT